jgi:undecaprenyl-diphosphatase
MTFLQALLLGALQGLTEFLPVSSSGHLVLLQRLFGLREPALLFDILVHVATLGAVIIFYRYDVWGLIQACPGLSTIFRQAVPDGENRDASNRRLGILLLIANLPTAVIGLIFATSLEQLFATPWTVGIALLITGCTLWSLKGAIAPHNGLSDMHVGHALLLGVIQGLAITPGISRSGSTIAVALWCGLRQEAAARFSFLMAIPAIIGAMLLKSRELSALSRDQMGLMIVGMLTALVVGYLALRFLLRLLMRGNFWYFAIYCWLVGAAAVLTAF